MRFFTAITLLNAVAGLPVIHRRSTANPTTADIFQLALYLESLQIALYKSGFTKFPKSAFAAAGFDANYYQNLQGVLQDHESYLEFVTVAGITDFVPFKSCTYSFPFNDVPSFVRLSAILEGLATSYYIGAQAYIPAALEAGDSLSFQTGLAGSISAVDGRHAALHLKALTGSYTDNAFIPQLGPNETYSYASSFVTSCPSSNYQLPFIELPPITPNVTQVKAGQYVDFYTPLPVNNSVYALFINGHYDTAGIILTKGDKQGHFHVQVPSGIAGDKGQTYVLITEYDENSASIVENALAGPAVLQVFA